MQRMSDVIRGSLARSLRQLEEEDRLAAALPVVCGTALAAHCSVANLDDQRTLHLVVDAPEWLPPLLNMRDLLHHDLQRVAGVPLAGLHFMGAGSASKHPGRPLADGVTQPAPQGRLRRFPQRSASPRRPA